MFKEYKVIVTGASTVLGEMLVKTFLSQGALVLGIDKTDSCIKDDHYRFIRHAFVSTASAESVCAVAKSYFEGSLDILINIMPGQEYGNLQSVSGKDFAECLTESLFPTIEMTRELYTMLSNSEQENPSVVNIGSSYSRNVTMSSGLECLCAQALISLTRMQAGFFDGVRCNSISPVKPENPDICQDIINSVLFLCSRDASYITGADFLLDYGESARNAARLEAK